jgi:DNA-binding NarL/FixJ family response regulator
MAKAAKTYIFCYDDHRSFSEDVRKRFSDSSRYEVFSFQTPENFIKHLEEEREHNFCKVAILDVHDVKDQIEMVDNLTMEIKRIDNTTGLIILAPNDKIEDIRKAIKFNIDSYIPRNANTILRIHNTVKKLISEHSLVIFRKQRNLSVYFFLAFLIISALVILIAWFRFPMYF